MCDGTDIVGAGVAGKSGWRGVCDGIGIVGVGIVGAESGWRMVCDCTGANGSGVESERHQVCDGVSTVGMRAMGGRVWRSIRRKIFRKKYFLIINI